MKFSSVRDLQIMGIRKSAGPHYGISAFVVFCNMAELSLLKCGNGLEIWLVFTIVSTGAKSVATLSSQTKS